MDRGLKLTNQRDGNGHALSDKLFEEIRQYLERSRTIEPPVSDPEPGTLSYIADAEPPELTVPSGHLLRDSPPDVAEAPLPTREHQGKDAEQANIYDNAEDEKFEPQLEIPGFNKSNVVYYIKKQHRPSFRTLVLLHIDVRHEKESAVYRRAFLDRRIFSKIRNDGDYHPSKETAISLALSLKLDKNKAEELLASAGYTLSRSSSFDLIISFCIEHEIYDLFDVNSILEYFGLPLLGE